ncbi:N-acetylglucosamine kinase [Paenibacillus mendelii]|uniref:N-acetylglucosamine kinase n=1 Tax=Paenibacillus mendelii TaxID=206163 RepID=A0ABV6JKX0_9BACL|nr:BadF/BadG/BcrA/BcrD ATPase family protein [Paenibacillus mendelii]
MSQIMMSIDSGGSKTICLLQTTEGELLGWGLGGPTHHLSSENASHSFIHAIKMAMEGGGVSGSHISLVSYSQLGQFEALQSALEQSQVGADSIYLDDPTVALVGALCSEWGVVALSGTGSFVYARNREGQTMLVGGLGDLLGDDGSGYEIGLSGLRAALRYVEGWEEETMLADAICKEWGISEFHKNAPFMNPVSRTIADNTFQYMPDSYRHRIANLSRIVAKCAREGDSISLAIIQQAGKKLGCQVAAICDQMDMGREPIPIGYAGGCWRIGDILIEPFQATLKLKMKKSFHLTPQALEPAFGVFLGTLRHMGVSWDGELISRLKRDNDFVKKAITNAS